MNTSAPQAQESCNEPLRDQLRHLRGGEIKIWRELVSKDPNLFAQIYQWIFCDDPRIAWHAAWITDHAAEANPALLGPYVPEIIDTLHTVKSSQLKRHFTRMLIGRTLPEDKIGPFIDLLYRLLSPSEAIAVRANALQLLHDIALREPELIPELIAVTEALVEERDQLGICAKGRNVLRSLKRQ
ncbi:MAG: hypothetical protein LWW85_00240 [Marinilabiliales bacterium]|nr:hypothetical protein [Marinilabiliales bacterium]